MEKIIFEGITADDFFNRLKSTLKKEESYKPVYSTRAETAKRLHITLPTLNKFTKLGLIKSHTIGTRVLYEEMDILKALESGKSLKYRR